MRIIILLLFGFFSTVGIAETELLVEKKGQQVHFVYPDLKDDGAYYYAMWIEGENNCNKFNIDAYGLIISNYNKFYIIPTNKGILCLGRSNKQLDVDWDRFQVYLDNENLKDIDENIFRDMGAPPEPLEDETKYCKFVKNKLSICTLKL